MYVGFFVVVFVGVYVGVYVGIFGCCFVSVYVRCFCWCDVGSVCCFFLRFFIRVGYIDVSGAFSCFCILLCV